MISKVRTLEYLSKSDEIAPPQAHPTCNPIEPARSDRMSAVFLKILKMSQKRVSSERLSLTFWRLLVTLGALFLVFKGPGGRLEM